MNILILANKPPYPAKDGSSLATLSMAMGLAKSENNVTLLAITTPKHSCKIEQIPTEIRKKINFNLVYVDTRIKPIKAIYNLIFTRFPYTIERFVGNHYRFKLIEILSKNNFDIIQFEGLCILPYIKDIRKITKTPIVYRSHNIEHEIWSRISINEKNWLKTKYFKVLSNRIRKMELGISAQVDAIVSISKRDEQWFRANGFNKPSISVPLGYPTSENKDKVGLSNKDICYLGSLDWMPNQEGLKWFLDEVWHKILNSTPETTLHVAGRNSPNIITERLTKERRVTFHGEVENAEEYLKNFSILVVPILSGSGMRVKIVEGMMLGKAIVTTTIGIEGIDAINREHAIIADTPNDFAEAIIELIRNQTLKASIAEKGRIFASSHFDNSKLTKELEEFYKQLV